VANLDPEKQRDQMRAAFESSPMACVKTWRSPVHGDDDRNVDFKHRVKIMTALRAQRVDFEELIFPDEIHDLLLLEHWVNSIKAADDFFSRKLLKSR
jgi:dipeptidyl aminopeptidase/acylaminoacyl peptidase